MSPNHRSSHGFPVWQTLSAHRTSSASLLPHMPCTQATTCLVINQLQPESLLPPPDSSCAFLDQSAKPQAPCLSGTPSAPPALLCHPFKIATDSQVQSFVRDCRAHATTRGTTAFEQHCTEECVHLQRELPLWGDLARSACVGQLDGGLVQVTGRRPSDAKGRSGLFTTSLPGCTPCTTTHSNQGDSHRKCASMPAPQLLTFSREVGATQDSHCVKCYLQVLIACTDMQCQGQMARKKEMLGEVCPPVVVAGQLQRDPQSAARMSQWRGLGRRGRPQGSAHRPWEAASQWQMDLPPSQMSMPAHCLCSHRAIEQVQTRDTHF